MEMEGKKVELRFGYIFTFSGEKICVSLKIKSGLNEKLCKEYR